MTERQKLMKNPVMWVGLLALVMLAVLVFFTNGSFKVPAPPQEVFLATSGGDTAQTVATPVTTNDSYKLVVGVNPMVNPKQVFQPPTNSVVVTNNAQLQSLTEQAKKSHQQKIQ